MIENLNRSISLLFTTLLGDVVVIWGDQSWCETVRKQLSNLIRFGKAVLFFSSNFGHGK